MVGIATSRPCVTTSECTKRAIWDDRAEGNEKEYAKHATRPASRAATAGGTDSVVVISDDCAEGNEKEDVTSNSRPDSIDPSSDEAVRRAPTSAVAADQMCGFPRSSAPPAISCSGCSPKLRPLQAAALVGPTRPDPVEACLRSVSPADQPSIPAPEMTSSAVAVGEKPRRNRGRQPHAKSPARRRSGDDESHLAANRRVHSRHEPQEDRTYVGQCHGRQSIGMFAKRAFPMNSRIAEFVKPRVIGECEYLSVTRALASQGVDGRTELAERGCSVREISRLQNPWKLDTVQNKTFAILLPGSQKRSWLADDFILSEVDPSCPKELNTWWAMAHSSTPNVCASIEYRDRQGSARREILRYRFPQRESKRREGRERRG